MNIAGSLSVDHRIRYLTISACFVEHVVGHVAGHVVSRGGSRGITWRVTWYHVLSRGSVFVFLAIALFVEFES